MRIHRGLMGWGIFLIVLGVIPLAVSRGLLDPELAARAWRLWPLVLVGGGLGLLLRRTPLEGAGGFLVAATVGAMLGGLLAAGPTLRIPFEDAGCGLAGGESPAFPSREGSFGSSAEVDLELSCGDLTVTTAAGSGWAVGGSGDDGDGPEVEASGDSLHVRSSGSGPFDGARDVWRVTLPTDPELDLGVNVNAGSGRVDLAGATLRAMRLDVNAADVVADLTEASGSPDLEVSANAASVGVTLPLADVRGSISANAGSVELCVPDGMGIRLVTEESLTAGYDFARTDLVRSGDTWQSPGFDHADHRVELELSANAGSIVLDPVDGCD